MPKKKLTYGPYQTIIEHYGLFRIACTKDTPLEHVAWNHTFETYKADRLAESPFLVVDFDVRPQRRVFEENLLRKFETQPFWAVVAERAAKKAIEHLFPDKHKLILWEVCESKWGYCGSMVIPVNGLLTSAVVDYLYTRLRATKLTNTWTKKALKYETGKPDGIAVTVREPLSKLTMPMVVEGFTLSNGFEPCWRSYNWRRLSLYLKSLHS